MIALRILVSPLILSLYLIFNLAFSIKSTIFFILNGGELISYDKKDRKCIYDLYIELQKQHNK
jgi:hypothetical protein